MPVKTDISFEVNNCSLQSRYQIFEVDAHSENASMLLFSRYEFSVSVACKHEDIC